MVYLPEGGEAAVDLSVASGAIMVEWLRPANGAVIHSESVEGGAERTFKPPFDGDAVLYLNAWTTEKQRRHE
jgi:hypothetical protein